MNQEQRGLFGGFVTGVAYSVSWAVHGIVSNLPVINELLQALATLVAIVVGIMTIRHYALRDRWSKADKHLEELRRHHNHRNYLMFWVIFGAVCLAWVTAAHSTGSGAAHSTGSGATTGLLTTDY